MLKIRLKKIMNVMFIVFVLEVLGCAKTYSMDKNPKGDRINTSEINTSEINTNGNKYQETYGEGFLLGGCDLNDSYSSSVSNENKVVQSGKYKLELEPIKTIKCVEKNNNVVVDAKNNKNNNKKENKKEIHKECKDNFDVLKINEEKKKLDATSGKGSSEFYNVGGVLLTEAELEYNKIFFNKNKNNFKENEKEVRDKKQYEEKDEDIAQRIRDNYFGLNLSGFGAEGPNSIGDYVQGYREIMSLKLLEAIEKAKNNYIRYLRIFLGLLQSKSVFKLSLEDGDALYPSENVLSKDYMFSLIRIFRYFGQAEVRKICAKENLTLEDYFNKTYKKLFAKYKGRIYNNAETLGFNLQEIVTNFLVEIQCKIYYDMLNDPDLFYYDQSVKEKEIEGYDLKGLFTKMRNLYSFYKEPRTGINLVVFKGTTDSDLVVYIKNPNGYVLNLAKNLSKEFEDVVLKKTDLGLQIILKKIDNRGIGRKVGDYRIFERLIPIVKNVYCTSKEKDILFILLNSRSVEGFMNDFIDGEKSFIGEDTVFFRNVMNSIKEKILNKVDDKNVVNEYELAKAFEDFVLEEKEADVIEKGFFKCDKGTAKYVADVICDFPKDYFAKDKDIFNFYDEFLTKIVPKIKVNEDLDFREIKDIKLISRNMEDYLRFKVYTDSEDVIKNIKSYCLVFLKKIEKFLNSNLPSTPKSLYNVNQTLVRYNEYLKNEKGLDNFFKKHPEETDFRIKFLRDFKSFYEDRSDEKFFKKASAVAFVDWSKLYRGHIPVLDLIIKSFEKESIPFSKYYFDIGEGNYIEDYILRICENIKDGVNKFRHFVNLFDYDKNLFKIKIYYKNK